MRPSTTAALVAVATAAVALFSAPHHAGAVEPVPAATEADSGPLFDPMTGYRIRQYRAPAPPEVTGGTTVTLEQLIELRNTEQAILIDVMAADGAVADPKTGVWQITKPRKHIAGSVWLPDVGQGVLTPALDAYFRDNLTRLTNRIREYPMIFYCQANCWLSWNAVKRANSYGYTKLYWYPGGTDGLRNGNVPLVDAVPVPMPSMTSAGTRK